MINKDIAVHMITKKNFIGLGPEKSDCPSTTKITRGKKYEIEIHHRQIAPDAYLQERFFYINDDDKKVEISTYFFNSCFAYPDKWREIQLSELSIN
jgi:hypothetical protein